MAMNIIKNKNYKTSNTKTSGTTLVSLIISMSLSIFLITAVLQVFTITKKNFRVMQNIMELNSSLRYITYNMGKMISYTGYRNIPSNNTTTFGSFCLTCCGCYMGLYTWPYINSGLPDGQRDQPIIMYFGNNTTFGNTTKSPVDCSGNIIPSGTIERAQFSVVNVTGRPGLSLRCDDINSVGSSIGFSYLVSDLVDGMWVRYGYDTVNDGSGSVNYYSNVFGPWIRAIRVAILLHTRDSIFTQAKTQTFSVFGNTITKTSTQLYRLHIFTIPFTHLPPILP